MLNLFQNDSESGMIPFPEYFIRNLYVHRFRLSSRSADTRRRIVRWLFLHFHVYDYHPADAETTGRYLSRERFPPLLFMTLTEENRRAAAAIFAQMTPGGMIGGYCEEGFPLYFINDQLLNYLGYDSYEGYVVVFGYSPLRYGSSFRFWFGLRTSAVVCDRYDKYSRRDSFPSYTEECRFLISHRIEKSKLRIERSEDYAEFFI